MPDKIFTGDKDDLPCRLGNGERTYQFFLLFTLLQGSQFRDERNTVTAFHHTHKCL